MSNVQDVPSTSIIPEPHMIWIMTNPERKEILNKVSKEVVNKFIDFSFRGPTSAIENDDVHKYAKHLLGLGLFYLEFSDAIREGDGSTILRCWRYLLPIFLGSNRTNYSCEVLNMLFQHSYGLSPRLSAQLLWSRCVNLHGRPGKNIPANLHMEHLNRLDKEVIKNLGANKTEKAICRVGCAIGTIAPVLRKFDEQNDIDSPTGAHKVASYTRDRNIVVSELCYMNVFNAVPGRAHSSFKKPRNILHTKAEPEIILWMCTRLQSHHLT